MLANCHCKYAGKPAYVMDRSNVDWTPCLELGHHKISASALQEASGRATYTALRRRRIIEARDANTIPSLRGLDNTDPGPKLHRSKQRR